ncbi:unnamed protein product, partial [Vitis vinifera]
MLTFNAQLGKIIRNQKLSQRDK